MASKGISKSSEEVPLDLLPVIRRSGVLNDRQFAELKAKVLSGEFPHETGALAERLVKEGIFTAYQVRRFLRDKAGGLVVGRYVILDRLGSGSMGRVYKAHHLMMDRSVALKVIAPEIASNDRVLARFQREMKMVGRLDHPNVVRAYDADQVNNILYIVMEYVPGQSLGQTLREGPVAPADMVHYAAQAALGLAHAHEQGIVHRDIKPSNLLLTGDRQVKVLDLGLGVLMEADSQATFATADGIAVGTVDYMSPEQACGRDVDGRSDLFNLGCSMYHLMTGRLPYPGDSPLERLSMRIAGRPAPIREVRPDIPQGVVQVLEKLIAHRPQDRFQSAHEAAEALQALLRPRAKPSSAPSRRTEKEAEKEPAAAPPPPPVEVHIRPEYPAWFAPAASLAERNPAAALLGAIGGALAFFAAGFGLAWLLL